MSLDDFLLLVIKDVVWFGDEWTFMHSQDPDHNPLELPSASEWYEQFMFWKESQNG